MNKEQLHAWYIGAPIPKPNVPKLTQNVQRATDRVTRLQKQVQTAKQVVQGPQANNATPKEFKAAQDALDRHVTNLKDAQSELKSAQQKLDAAKKTNPPKPPNKPPTGGATSNTTTRSSNSNTTYVQDTLLRDAQKGVVGGLVAAGTAVVAKTVAQGPLGWFLAGANP